MARHGENIRKRKDGRWEGRYYMPDIQTGQLRSFSVYARSYDEVKEKLMLAKGSIYTRTYSTGAEVSKTLFREVAEEWLEGISRQRKHSTCVKYRFVYDCHIEEILGNIKIKELTQKDINGLAASVVKLSPSIHKSVRNVTNQILQYMSVKYEIPKYVFVGLQSKQISKPIETLTKTEQIKLVNFLCTDTDLYKAGILLCLSTGLRLGEICALKWSDIDFENKLLHINRTVQRIAVKSGETKTALVEGEPKSCFSKREIPLADEISKLLLPYKKADGYFFKETNPLEPRTYQNKYAKYLKHAGICRSHFHILRHTFATNCIYTRRWLIG